MIDFCQLGFIGKLFRSSDLQRMKTYFLLFQEEKPGDILIRDMSNIMTQFKPIRSIKSLFQHRGLVSSLKNKVQKLTDKPAVQMPMEFQLGVDIHIEIRLVIRKGKPLTKLHQRLFLLRLTAGRLVRSVQRLTPVDIYFGVPVQLLTQSVEFPDAIVLL